MELLISVGGVILAYQLCFWDFATITTMEGIYFLFVIVATRFLLRLYYRKREEKIQTNRCFIYGFLVINLFYLCCLCFSILVERSDDQNQIDYSFQRKEEVFYGPRILVGVA